MAQALSTHAIRNRISAATLLGATFARCPNWSLWAAGIAFFQQDFTGHDLSRKQVHAFAFVRTAISANPDILLPPSNILAEQQKATHLLDGLGCFTLTLRHVIAATRPV